MCRHIEGNCPAQNCTFPHDFTKGYNRKIVMDHHCQHINPVLLVKLLRLKTFSSRPPHTRHQRGGRGRNRRGRGRGHGDGNHVLPRLSSIQKDDSDRQLDVSFPSSSPAKHIDMEIIGMLLNLRGITVEDKFNEHDNEYCHRGTIQLERVNGMEFYLLFF
jgi:hypothetical protein